MLRNRRKISKPISLGKTIFSMWGRITATSKRGVWALVKMMDHGPHTHTNLMKYFFKWGKNTSRPLRRNRESINTEVEK